MVPATLLVGTLSACQLMRRTEANEVEKAKRAVASSLIDPSAAQFRNVDWRSGWVCGELNGQAASQEKAGLVELAGPDLRPLRIRDAAWVACRSVKSGAAYRTRTCDPRITNAMLYQLS